MPETRRGLRHAMTALMKSAPSISTTYPPRYINNETKFGLLTITVKTSVECQEFDIFLQPGNTREDKRPGGRLPFISRKPSQIFSVM